MRSRERQTPAGGSRRYEFDIIAIIDSNEIIMASITIRNLPTNTKEALRVRAAKSGISLEAYSRKVLQNASEADVEDESNLVELARECFGEKRGTDLELPPRGNNRPPLSFE